jgi:hypothetical protein
LILSGDIITAVVKLDASQCTLDTTSVSFEFKQKMVFASKSDIICVESVASKCPSDILKAGEVSERIVALATPENLHFTVKTTGFICRSLLPVILNYGICAKEEASAEIIVEVKARIGPNDNYDLPPYTGNSD